nr:GNAT family N-acetyltransferase [Streptomyces sp. HNM0574]
MKVRITASDVGKRVSVRSLTGSGAPGGRFTDTVGVLTSWTEGVLSVTRRDGETVRLAEDAVVAGKVIPREPARKRGLPAASVPELRRTAARSWPAVETEPLGAWTLRAAAEPGGTPGSRPESFTSRANSVLAVGDPGIPLDAALERVVRWYGERGLDPLMQVATADDGSGEMLAAALEERGWGAEKHTLSQIGALAPLADRAPDPRVELARTPDERWLAAYRRTGRTPQVALKVLSGGPSVWFATVPAEGAVPAAVGRCVVDGRWASFAAVEVLPERRRAGLATAVMGELARRALEEGASAACLQVERENTEALALYERLGFATHHAYHYRRAPRD